MDYSTIALLTGAGVVAVVLGSALDRLLGQVLSEILGEILRGIVLVVGTLLLIIIALICAPITVPYHLLRKPGERVRDFRAQRAATEEYRQKFENRG